MGVGDVVGVDVEVGVEVDNEVGDAGVGCGGRVGGVVGVGGESTCREVVGLVVVVVVAPGVLVVEDMVMVVDVGGQVVVCLGFYKIAPYHPPQNIGLGDPGSFGVQGRGSKG